MEPFAVPVLANLHDTHGIVAMASQQAVLPVVDAALCRPLFCPSHAYISSLRRRAPNGHSSGRPEASAPFGTAVQAPLSSTLGPKECASILEGRNRRILGRVPSQRVVNGVRRFNGKSRQVENASRCGAGRRLTAVDPGASPGKLMPTPSLKNPLIVCKLSHSQFHVVFSLRLRGLGPVTEQLDISVNVRVRPKRLVPPQAQLAQFVYCHPGVHDVHAVIVADLQLRAQEV